MMLMSRGNRKLIYPDVLQMFKIGIIASFSWEMSNFFKASMRAVQWICFSLSPDPAKWGRANKQPNNKRKYHNIPVSCLLVSSEIKSIYCWPASANIYSIFYVTYLFFFSITVACQHAAEGKNILKACMESSPEATRVTSWIWSQSQTFGLGCSWTLTVSHTNTVTDTFCAWFKQQF